MDFHSGFNFQRIHVWVTDAVLCQKYLPLIFRTSKALRLQLQVIPYVPGVFVPRNGNSRSEKKAASHPTARPFVQVIYRIEFLIKLEYISCFVPCHGLLATIFSFT